MDLLNRAAKNRRIQSTFMFSISIRHLHKNECGGKDGCAPSSRGGSSRSLGKSPALFIDPAGSITFAARWCRESLGLAGAAR